MIKGFDKTKKAHEEVKWIRPTKAKAPGASSLQSGIPNLSSLPL